MGRAVVLFGSGYVEFQSVRSTLSLNLKPGILEAIIRTPLGSRSVWSPGRFDGL